MLQPVNGRDFGKAYYQILMKPEIVNGDYVLSGEKPISMAEMFKLINHTLNKEISFITVPLSIGVFIARCLKLFTLGKVDYVEKVQRMGENRSFSHEAAEKNFGYKPMPFNEGLRIEVEECLKTVR